MLELRVSRIQWVPQTSTANVPRGPELWSMHESARLPAHASPHLAAPAIVCARSPKCRCHIPHDSWTVELLPAVSNSFLPQLLSTSLPPSQPWSWPWPWPWPWPWHLVTVQHSHVDFHGCFVFPQGRGCPGVQVHADSHVLGAGGDESGSVRQHLFLGFVHGRSEGGWVA